MHSTTDSLLTEYIPPTGRRPPPELVRDLREIVPSAELIYMGKGVWSLGTVRHNRLVHRAACMTITKIHQMLALAGQGDFFLQREHLRELHSRLFTLHLHRQGYRPIQLFHIQGAPDSRITEDLAEREWGYRTKFEVHVREAEQESVRDRQLEERQKKVAEYFRLEHKSIHRHAFRKAKSVISAGIEKAKTTVTRLTERKAS